MAEPFLGEITMVGFNFAPRGWALCDGQILPINQNQSLYSLLGTTYGGDGRTTFALPDLRGRASMHKGQGHPLGQRGGSEEVTLTEMPEHTHQLVATNAVGNNASPTGNLLARPAGPYRLYGNAGNLVDLASNAISSVGGQGHTNMQPILTINFCIALQGLFPSRN